MTDKIKAYAYLRVSSQKQTDGDGFDRQLETINRFANESNVEIVDIYRDAYSGTEEDRPQYMVMLEKMLENGVKTVVVECLDRLARDLMVQSLLLSKLESEHLSLLNAMTGEDVTASMRDDPMRRAMVQIQGVFAELDRNLLTAKLRKARNRKKAAGTGGKEGIKPFGDKPGEKPILDSLLGLADLGHGPTEIAERLNAQRLPTRRGGKWSKQSVHTILKREVK